MVILLEVGLEGGLKGGVLVGWCRRNDCTGTAPGNEFLRCTLSHLKSLAYQSVLSILQLRNCLSIIDDNNEDLTTHT